MTPLEIVLAYHDRTKHHPRRFARGPGHLDWANQPDPFRRFDAAPLYRLPIPRDDDTPPYESIYVPGAVPPRPLTLENISRLLYLSLAISAWKQAGRSRWALRCNPSSGNLHPTEGYLILPPLAGLADHAGVYHYAPREHALEQRAELPPSTWEALTAGLPGGTFLAGLSTIYWREAWKYGERAFRYCQHDTGHALGALWLAAAALGWKLAALTQLSDDDVAALLGLDRPADFAGAERESPELIAAVFPADAESPPTLDVPPHAISAVRRASWTGRANRLSAEHVEWDLIDLVADATCKPRTPAPPACLPSSAAVARAPRPSLSPDPAARDAPPVSAARIFRGRRSALDYDGQTSVPLAAFVRMLRRVMPGPVQDRKTYGLQVHPTGLDHARTTGRDGLHATPCSALPGPICIHLFLFVHLVEGLPRGVYVLVREPTALDDLRRATSPDFAWTRPPGSTDDLPLYLLKAADARAAAAQLSLGQSIAGQGAFSLGMVADFERPLREHGAWFYRHLFWEAGLLGQVLYVEAEAAGVRATGIGAYFDDWVHAVLGLRDHRYQSLYHFAVGGPVDDPRITTLPAYPSADG